MSKIFKDNKCQKGKNEENNAKHVQKEEGGKVKKKGGKKGEKSEKFEKSEKGEKKVKKR